MKSLSSKVFLKQNAIVMSKPGKLSKDRSKVSKQPKLTEFRAGRETQNSSGDMAEENSSGVGELVGEKADTILTVLDSIKTEFSGRFDGVMIALADMRKEVNECTQRVSQAKLRISNTEDEVASLQAKVHTLKSKNKTLEDKLLDLETRSRLNSVRLVGLLEGVEGRDPCSFLEKWIPEVLDITSPQAVVIERAQRVGPPRDSGAPPRTLIMKFLSYKDKQAVSSAMRTKKDVRYKDQQVKIYPDLATGIHQLRKQFDPVRQELRNLGIRHGVIHPAKLIVTYKNRTYTFKSAKEAQEFINNIQK